MSLTGHFELIYDSHIEFHERPPEAIQQLYLSRFGTPISSRSASRPSVIVVPSLRSDARSIRPAVQLTSQRYPTILSEPQNLRQPITHRALIF